MRLGAPPTLPGDVWDFLSASAIVANSLGKAIADNVDAKISERSTPSSILTGFLRNFEAYTPTPVIITDNSSTPVVLLNITGRGILVAIGGALVDTALDLRATVIIDGDTIINNEAIFDGKVGVGVAMGIPLLIGFDTSCVVSMVLSGGGPGRYYASALVE